MVYHTLNNSKTGICCFSSMRDGGVSEGNYSSLNLSPFSGDTLENYTRNRDIVCAELHIPVDNLIVPYQTHGSEVRVVDNQFFRLSEDEKQAYLSGVDALITNQKNICICVTTADCVSLFFADYKKGVIAMAHAGWRGTCAKIAQKTIEQMSAQFQSNPSDLEVVIGPAISVACYEVGVSVVDEFNNAGFDTNKIVAQKDKSYFLNLEKANQLLLEEAGVENVNIHKSGICTFTQHEQFFSARRLGIKSGRILNGIFMRN